MGNDAQLLTYEQVLALYPPDTFKQAIKTATLRIRPFTKEDEQTFPPTRDLEGRLIKAKVGRCLCIGVEGELFTCSLWSVQNEREPVHLAQEPDAEGFREYRMRDPRPIWYLTLDVPFKLKRPDGDVWESQADGGVITWNGEVGSACVMRVLKTSIFVKTYTLLESGQA
ncbi:MAG TPA: hypothetical protein VKT82_34960 [Ktedonobacterales bacterium]|nr:hypothetical protein [Ktedonobacterales bacterium]